MNTLKISVRIMLPTHKLAENKKTYTPVLLAIVDVLCRSLPQTLLYFTSFLS